MKRTTSPLAIGIAALLLCGAIAVASPQPAAAKHQHHHHHGTKTIRRKIAPGLVLTKIIDYDTPRRTFALRADLSKALTFDVTLADAALPSRAKTSAMARHEGALAAINGDFGSNSLRPEHPFAQDGQLVQTSPVRGVMFAVSDDERDVYVGQPSESVTVTESDGTTWAIGEWNHGTPSLGEINAFSPFGGTLEAPPEASCSAHLTPAGPPAPVSGGTGLAQPYTVDATGCSEAPMTRDGGLVLSAVPATEEAVRLLSLEPGSSVTVTWSFGWPGVYDAIGGVPLLVADGANAVKDCSGGVCSRNPRTAIGVTTEGKLLMVVVDGRQPKYSVGASMREFADLLLGLGAQWAVNLDGGGSSTMVIEGAVVNEPSDGFERAVTNAALILPGPDPDEG